MYTVVVLWFVFQQNEHILENVRSRNFAVPTTKNRLDISEHILENVRWRNLSLIHI